MKYNFQLEGLEKLLPAGFKKQREFFFIIREPNMMVIFRKFEPKGANEYYLAFTHTFFSSVKDKRGKYLIPPLLEHYPVSIAADQLRTQYSLYPTIHAFECELHHLSRTLFPTKGASKKPNSPIVSFIRKLTGRKSVHTAGNPVEIALHEGMRLFSEFSPALSYQILLKNKNKTDEMLSQQIAECREYLNTHDNLYTHCIFVS